MEAEEIREKFRQQLKKIKRVKNYKNWKEIYCNLRKGEHPGEIILRNGLVIYGYRESPFLDTVDHVFLENVYTPFPLKVDRNDIVIDIGAACGVFSLFAAGKTKNTVFAFEPEPKNFELLNKNIQTNFLSNVKISNNAVSDKVGTTKLFIYKRHEWHTIINNYSADILGSFIEVPTVTLEHIIKSNKLNKIDFLKMDCEGAEGLILKSINADILKMIKKIAIEFHDDKSEMKHDEISSLMKKAGFDVKLSRNKNSAYGYIYAWAK